MQKPCSTCQSVTEKTSNSNILRPKAKSFDPALLTITRGQSHKLYLELYPYCAEFFLCEHGLSATGPVHYVKGAPSIAPALCPTHIDATKRGLLMMLMSLHSMHLLLVQKQCTQGAQRKGRKHAETSCPLELAVFTYCSLQNWHRKSLA